MMLQALVVLPSPASKATLPLLAHDSCSYNLEILTSGLVLVICVRYLSLLYSLMCHCIGGMHLTIH